MQTTEDPHKPHKVLKVLGKGRFTVYLTQSKSSLLTAMKVFPHIDSRPSKSYFNEKKAQDLDHSHVIRVLSCHEKERCYQNKAFIDVSYVILEYAPYGDFYDFLMTKKILIDDKLIRTYFHQLIEGLEYLHSHGVAHLDIKLENLLIGKDYLLKLADFDFSHVEGDKNLFSCGTSSYRAPEIVLRKDYNPFKADIYSAGILLFVFKTRGILPYSEDCNLNVDLSSLMEENDPKFWDFHEEMSGERTSEEDFRELFLMMTRAKAEERGTIEVIKGSKWYNGPVYEKNELKKKMFMLDVGRTHEV